MARKHNRKNHSQNNDGGNDFASDDASDLGELLSPVSPPTAPLRSAFNYDPASEINDGRFYHPQTRSLPSTRPSQTTRLLVRDRQPSHRQALKSLFPKSQTKAVLAFSSPAGNHICQRRKTRREVLFAKKKRGRGGPRKRNWTSFISCR